MAPRKKKHPINWTATCRGKQLLLRDLREGLYPEDMPFEEVFYQRPEFDVGVSHSEAKRLFENRLKAARKLVTQNNTRSASELVLMQQDRAAHPPPARYPSGEPRWDGSAAQALLKEDVKNKVHESMSREAFYTSRTEYYLDFSLQTISNHVDQEVRSSKFLKQYRARRDYF